MTREQLEWSDYARKIEVGIGAAFLVCVAFVISGVWLALEVLRLICLR